MEVPITSSRSKKIRHVASLRQLDLTVVIENVHDSHNIAAILRSCDSVGISEIYVLYTDSRLSEEKFKVGAKTSSGARRWVDIHFFNDVTKCFEAVKIKYQNIFATHLSTSACSLYDLSLTDSTALVFGNEHEGITEESLKYATGNFVIPMMGMTQSLNISVACAVALYETCRQRIASDKYGQLDADVEQFIYDEYAKRHLNKSGR